MLFCRGGAIVVLSFQSWAAECMWKRDDARETVRARKREHARYHESRLDTEKGTVGWWHNCQTAAVLLEHMRIVWYFGKQAFSSFSSEFSSFDLLLCEPWWIR